MSKSKLLIGLIIVILIAAGVWYIEQPARVVAAATENFAKAKTVNFTSTITIDNLSATQPSLGEAGSVVIGLDGGYSRQNNAPADIATKVKVTAKTNSVSVQGDGELRMLKNKIYVLINSIPPTLAPLAPVKGQWMVFDRGTVAEANQASSMALPFQNIKRIGTDTVNGTSTVKYQATLSADGVIALTDGLNFQLRGNHLTPDQITSLKSNLASQESVPITLWIKRWTRQLQQISVSSNAPNGTKMIFVMTIKNTNQPVNITQPADAKSLQDLVGTPQPTPATTPTPSATPK